MIAIDAGNAASKIKLSNPYLDASTLEGTANRGMAFAMAGHYSHALSCYKSILNLFPQLLLQEPVNYAYVVQRIIECYVDLGDCAKAITFANTHQEVVSNNDILSELLGFIFLHIGDKNSSLKYFRQSFMLKTEPKEMASLIPASVLKTKIKHVYEQLSYLALENKLSNSGALVLDSIMKIGVENFDHVKISQGLLNTINACHYFPDLSFSGIALGLNNYYEIERQYIENQAKLVVIDNFLSEEALLKLRTFCAEANIWNAGYPRGYLGAVMGGGFCNDVLLSVAQELKKALPNVLGSKILSQAWGFKYDQGMKGIDLHADYSNVNVNFWITPDEACLDKTQGGMDIYDVAVPDDCTFFNRNGNLDYLQKHLQATGAKPNRINYKSNRCVIFDSSYIHMSNDLNFKEGYLNRRINCTFLYQEKLNDSYRMI